MSVSPVRAGFDDLALGHLGGSSFVHQGKRLAGQRLANLLASNVPLMPSLSGPWEGTGGTVRVEMSIGVLVSGYGCGGIRRQSSALGMVRGSCPGEAWMHALADGSAMDTVGGGGAGIFVTFPPPAGRFCSSYMAGTQALK